MKRSVSNPLRPLAALLLGLSAMFAAPARAHQDDTLCALPPDMPVRDTQVRTLDGKPLLLPGTAPTLVLFWSVFNPIPLPALAQASQQLATSYAGRLKVVGVNLDSRALVSHLDQKVRAKAHDLGMSFPQAMDPLRYSRDAFSLRKTPGAILVSGGRVVGVFSFDHAQDGVLLDALVRKTLETRSKR
ncbi:MAG TPA: hypothetical protein V6D05_01895 [Stenomitos sp.]